MIRGLSINYGMEIPLPALSKNLYEKFNAFSLSHFMPQFVGLITWVINPLIHKLSEHKNPPESTILQKEAIRTTVKSQKFNSHFFLQKISLKANLIHTAS
jgi:hypothetical protein